MGSHKNERSLSEASEGIAKFLLYLGLIFIIAFGYKAGKDSWIPKILRIPGAIGNVFGVQLPGGPRPVFPRTKSPINAMIVFVEAFPDRGRANYLLSVLKRDRINAKIIRVRAEHWVYLGPYTTSATARHAVSEMRRKGFRAQVLKPPPR